MAEPKIIPYTEDELYVVPANKAAPPPAKVVTMGPGGKVAEPIPAVNPFTPKVNKSFLEENKTLVIVSGIILIGMGLYIYYQHRQRKALELEKKKESPIYKYSARLGNGGGMQSGPKI